MEVTEKKPERKKWERSTKLFETRHGDFQWILKVDIAFPELRQKSS